MILARSTHPTYAHRSHSLLEYASAGAMDIGGDNVRKTQCAMQQLIIENLLLNCDNNRDSSESDVSPQMVGYYSTGLSDDSRLVVCSPDLPITVSQPALKVTSSSPTIHQDTGYMLQASVKRKDAAGTEDPYQCNICSKTFAVPARLTRHYRTHTGEKPFQCEYCSKSFSVKENLSVHRRIHTKERPYKCELHQVAHYGEKVYKCTICNDTFNSKKCMESHIKSHSEGSTSSSASSTSDKENSETTLVPTQYEDNREMRYFINSTPDYLQPTPYNPSGVDLLAAAAAASVTEENLTSPEDVINLITNHNSRKLNASPPLVGLRHPTYFSAPINYDVGLDQGNDIRRRVEAALAVASEGEQLLTPPSSNPVSPEPALSPDPVTIVVTKHELSLPPRKRSKMILKSMESELDAAAALTSAVRYNSVIQYARAS
ncbi:Kruppel homolog 1 [Carabus blaptoides fortunei]